MSLIFSYINYCNVVWGSAYDCHIKPLFVLQKRAIRIINRSDYTAESEPIFKFLVILSIPSIHKLNCLLFIYKCLTTSSFIYFKNRISQNTFSHEYRTRHKELLRPPRERLELVRMSYFYKGICLWNELDNDAKNIK